MEVVLSASIWCIISALLLIGMTAIRDKRWYDRYYWIEHFEDFVPLMIVGLIVLAIVGLWK